MGRTDTYSIFDIDRQNGVGNNGKVYRWIMTQNSTSRLPSMRDCEA